MTGIHKIVYLRRLCRLVHFRHLTTIGLLLAAALVLLPATQAAASNSTFYLRPNGNIELHGPTPWSVVGETSVWRALDDEVTESQTPTTADYIQATGAKEAAVGLGTVSIANVAVSKATLWVYSTNSQTFEFRSSADATWQTVSSAGWHSRSETISSQTALDNLGIYLRKQSGATASQVLAAFLKIETTGTNIYWGAWMDGDVYHATEPSRTDAPWDSTTWSNFEEHAGKKVSIVHFGQPVPWQQKFSPEPLEKAKARGALPLMDMGTGYKIGVTPKAEESIEEEEKNKVSLTEIKNGVYDSYFEEWAESVAGYGYPLFFRWAWEMNAPWFKWGRDAKSSPGTFVEAWRHIHNIAKAKGADNLTWVWCPNIETSETTSIRVLYPGDEYVDWTCLDGYNRNENSFAELFGSTYSLLTGEVAPNKPVMVGETASVETAHSEFKGNWIKAALSSLSLSFPKIEAFVWFNWNIVENKVELTWPIESSEQTRKAFAFEIGSPYFAENSFGSPEKLKPIQPLP